MANRPKYKISDNEKKLLKFLKVKEDDIKPNKEHPTKHSKQSFAD